MNRVPTIAAITGGLLVIGGVVAGGIAIAGEEAPAPTPAYVTVDDSPRPGLANIQQTPGERDCPKGGEGGAAEGGSAPVTNL